MVGAALTSVPAPTPGAIPWLVLRASRHVGSGLMIGAGHVLRTESGTAPAAGCDAAHVGAEEGRPYRATCTLLVEPALVNLPCRNQAVRHIRLKAPLSRPQQVLQTPARMAQLAAPI